jgi:hypothetical protein
MKQTVTIEVNLGPQFEEDEDGDLIAVDSADLSKQIVNAVAEKLIARYAYNEERKITEAIESAVKEAVVERVAATMQRPMQRFASVGYYGDRSEAVGEKFTLDELIAEAVQKFIDSKEAKQDGFGRQAGPMNLEQTVRLAVQEYLAKEAKPVIEQAKREVSSALLQQVTKSVIAALTPTVK